MNLVIVESPTKARTISHFLKNGYVVLSSFGHVRDLPKSKLGVDVQKDFEPQYVIPAKAKRVVAGLKVEAKRAQTIILATDADREGEAISWHLAQALGLRNPKSETRPFAKAPKDKQSSKQKTGLKSPTPKVERIVFHEITERAVKEALAHPRALDLNLVDAQQARRILDRLVGYELSPFLWKKVRAGLSAGRVQSVTVRLVVERERAIENFTPQEYWTIEAELRPPEEEKTFRAKLVKINSQPLEKLAVKNREEAEKILKDLMGAKYRVAEITKKELSRYPAPPFVTSTLQQEAARKFGFSAKQTMKVAQELYENGYITYMRTDSVNLAASAIEQAKMVIKQRFDNRYLNPRQYTTKSKGAQEAHEAIRPTNLEQEAEILREKLGRPELKIYDLIWKRTLASQMSPAVFDQTIIEIDTDTPYAFRAAGQILKFDGFLRVYSEGSDEPEEENGSQLPSLAQDSQLQLLSLNPFQHFTEPPPRFTDATLIKILESHGIGRPSTYAPILSTIQERGYAEKTEKKYHPTEIGRLVNDLLVENFPEIVDIGFTSHIEEELDEIAAGQLKWVPVIREFYTPFKKHLEEKKITVEKMQRLTDIPCPTCQKPMAERFGRQGKFLVCSDPQCQTTKPTPEEEKTIQDLAEKTKNEKCPQCRGPMNIKHGRFGYFLGCAQYPKCRGIAKIQNKTGFKCPACLAHLPDQSHFSEAKARRSLDEGGSVGELVERKSHGRGRIFYGCSRFPDCTFLTNKRPADEAELEEALKYWQENPPKGRKSPKDQPPETRK